MRHRTLVGGVGLGVLMLAVVTLAGSFTALSSRPPVSVAEPVKPIEPGTLSASQPRPEQAVPRPSDLPDGAYTYSSPSPTETGRRLPEPERCSLIPDPANLLRDMDAAEATGRVFSTSQGPTQVSRLLTAFAHSDGAAAMLRGIQRVTRHCNDFQAVLDHRAPVRVRADPYALRLTRTGRGRVTNGILAPRRAGHALSVLPELGGDDGDGDADADDDADGVAGSLKLVDVTLNRLTRGTSGLSDSRARLETCLGCGWL